MIAAVAQLCQDAEAVEPGQHEVEHEGVEGREASVRELQAGLAIGGEAGRRGLPAGVLGDKAGDLRVIFYDEDAHGRFSRGDGGGTAEPVIARVGVCRSGPACAPGPGAW